MSIFNTSSKKEERQILINDTIYKVRIYTENRANSRVSITKTGINIRLGKWLSKKQKEKQVEQFISWAEQTISERDISFAQKYRDFKNGEVLKLYDADVLLAIEEVESQKVSGKISDSKIIIKLPKQLRGESRTAHLSKIVSRLLAKRYKEKITKKLNDFNTKFKLGTINQVRLKNNSTNWGSCSSKNNINVSIRLLLAPEYALDYVLIHELCHLKHRNHSKQFWDLVEVCCPDYLKSEKWLKENSSSCII